MPTSIAIGLVILFLASCYFGVRLAQMADDGD